MAGVRLAALVRKLRRDAVFDSGGDSDAELLARFASARDELAFELLVWRHGAMVLAACRRALGHTEDAEDAFQATFLVLARKAHAVRRGTAVPAWLHRVAVRIAHRLAAGRRPTTTLATEPAARATPDAAELHELRGMLDAEIDRLSEPYRRAFVLCYLEGLSNADAARELGCPVGTIESRLTAARRTLRTRLARRLPLPAGALAALGFLPTLSATAVAEVKRAAAVAATRGLRAAIGIAREPAVRLAERAMIMTKLQKWVAGALSLALFGLAVGIGWARPTAEPPEAPKVAAAHPASVPPDTPMQSVSAPPPRLVEPGPKDAWPLTWTALLDGYGDLFGVDHDGRSLFFSRRDRGLHVVSLSGNGTPYVRVPDVHSIKPQHEVGDAAISPNGKLVATVGWGGGNVLLLDRATGKTVEDIIPSVSPWTRDLNGQWIPRRGIGFGTHIAGAGVMSIRGMNPKQVTFTPDGNKLIILCAHKDGSTVDGLPGFEYKLNLSASCVVLWDRISRREFVLPEEYNQNHHADLLAPTLAGHRRFTFRTQTVTETKPNGSKRVKERWVTIADALTGAARAPLQITDEHLSYQPFSDPLSPDGKTLVLFDPTKNELRFLATDTGRDRFRVPPFQRPVKAVAYSPDGKLVAAATGGDPPERDRARENNSATAPGVVIWDAATGKQVAHMIDNYLNCKALAFGPNGCFIAAQNEAGQVMIWGHVPAPEPAKATPTRAKKPTTSDEFQALMSGLGTEGVTDARRVEVLFLAALGRFPTDVEARTLAAQLARSSDKAAALRDLLGTLTETAEFRAHAAELQRMVK
ncbi:sigma-70 family RNA polymerase sigma factor [Gemmata sp. JC717]|uniref:sigma-70 family RNA polymerase sigma factor n=1 Tax=Gemmata algarum TaxID=2975278 RepID=UPI0021BB9AB1|nr:sigma-70 family RNA polymerase sigma factor [Gemmata algarum]MDY3554587.1 sigma-70 family RNA polymerase sigma factor [Gemmata algarum]